MASSIEKKSTTQTYPVGITKVNEVARNIQCIYIEFEDICSIFEQIKRNIKMSDFASEKKVKSK